MSLRLRLTLLASGALCVALVVGAIALTTVLRSTRIDALDQVVRDRAATVSALASDDRLPETLPVAEPGEIVQLIDADGAVLATSPNASRTLPVLPQDVLAGLSGVSTTDQSAYDDVARVAVQTTTFQDEPATVVATVPLTEVQGVLDALRVALAVVVPLLTVALGLVVWLILGRALRPVEELRRGAALVASSGGPGSLPVPARDDELGALARTLNSMLDRLEAGAARQRAFVADAAHELRSPLAALRTSIEVARAHPRVLPDRTSSRPSSRARCCGCRRWSTTCCCSRAWARRRWRTRRSTSARSRATWCGRRSPSTVTGSGHARGDAAAVGRVLRNLVDNAVRHAGSRVVVTVADGSVRVDDDGAGLDPADRERVFERFVRLDEARQRDEGGSGLGLAIAREIAREQGGDVVLGVADLGGLRAELRLPRTGPSS